MAEKIKKNVLFDKENLSLIDKFNSCQNETKDNGKVNEIISTFNNMIKYTKMEIKSAFNEQECLLLIEAISRKNYTPDISPKTFLIMNVKNELLFEKLDSKYQINSDELLDKLNSLTEFQLYVVLNMIYEYTWTPQPDINRIFLLDF